MKNLTNVLFLGCCAAERSLILEWADAGVLPAIKALMARGLTGYTENLPGFFVGTTWPSFATGVTPARHGIHSWKQLKPGTYDVYRCHAGTDIKREPFWNCLSRAGRRVAVLDVPHTYPTSRLNGIQVVEWGRHDADLGFATWPPTLKREIERRFGPNPLKSRCNELPLAGGHVAFRGMRDTLLRAVDLKAELTCHYLRQGGWDFFAQVFTESHCVGHQCWHVHDVTHPGHDPAIARRVGDPVKDVYRAIDRGVGRILNEVGPNTTVIFLAGHGMGPKYQAQFLLDKILLRLGVAEPTPGEAPARREERPGWLAPLKHLVRWAADHAPDEVRYRAAPVYDRVRRWRDGPPRPPSAGIDPSRSKCFSVENNFSHGGIRINLVGREPNGRVQRGPEWETLCRELTTSLLEIVNLDTGKPVVTRVIRTAEMYPGEYLDHLPDLLVDWSNDAPVRAIGSPRIGELRGEYTYRRTGDHRPGGLFVAAGPSIRHGWMDRTVSILDFAPTLTGLLGVDLPEVDGAPIPEVLGVRPAVLVPERGS
ncbi:MAG: alkaline phosphatase family protein [Candidatus Rokuibacteriota bacterium]